MKALTPGAIPETYGGALTYYEQIAILTKAVQDLSDRIDGIEVDITDSQQDTADEYRAQIGALSAECSRQDKLIIRLTGDLAALQEEEKQAEELAEDEVEKLSNAVAEDLETMRADMDHADDLAAAAEQEIAKSLKKQAETAKSLQKQIDAMDYAGEIRKLHVDETAMKNALSAEIRRETDAAREYAAQRAAAAEKNAQKADDRIRTVTDDIKTTLAVLETRIDELDTRYTQVMATLRHLTAAVEKGE